MPKRVTIKNAGFCITTALVAVAGVLAVNSCGSSPSTKETQSYTGAGSQWSVTLTDSSKTFVLTHSPSAGAAADQTMNGTYKSYDTGFLQLTVTSATGANTPAAGATAFALNIPGFIFFLAPVTAAGTNNIIPMVPAGTCPTTALNLDWIQVKPNESWSAATNPTAGAVTFDPASGLATVTAEYLLGSPASLGTQALGTGSCSNGVVTGIGSGGHTSDLFLTSGGGAIVHTATDAEAQGGDGIVFGLSPPDAAVSLPSLAGNYAGIAIGVGQSSLNGTAAVGVSATLTASGGIVSGPATSLMDVTTGKAGSGGAAIVINNSGPNNMLTGTIDTTGPSGGGTPGDMTCIVQQKAGGTTQTILACDGTTQSNPPQFFNVLLISH